MRDHSQGSPRSRYLNMSISVSSSCAALKMRSKVAASAETRPADGAGGDSIKRREHGKSTMAWSAVGRLNKAELALRSRGGRLLLEAQS